MGPMYFETPYFSSHIGPMYIGTSLTWNHVTVCKLFELKIVTWNYNHRQRLIITYLKLFNGLKSKNKTNFDIQ